MKNYFYLPDEELISLHKSKKINAITYLYYRYKNYSYAVIYQTLSKTPYLEKLYESKDAIIIDAIKAGIKNFNKEKGEFRSLYINIVKKYTIKQIQEFSRNPLSDYIPLSKRIPNTEGLTLMDVIYDDKEYDNPNAYTYKKESVENLSNMINEITNPRIKEVMLLRLKGLTYKEISEYLHCSKAAVYALIYRYKEKLNNKRK